MVEALKNIKSGDWVVYPYKNEIGLVKKVTENGIFVWWNIGDTAARSPFGLVKKVEFEGEHPPLLYSNKHAIPTLIERKKFINTILEDESNG